MGQLIYVTPTSLDGFIGDGDYSWAEPDPEFLAAVTATVAQAGTYLYGRRTYETMMVWETIPELAEQSDGDATFAATWQAADKIVFSSTMAQADVPTQRTRVEPHLDVGAVRELKAASRTDLTIGGPALAAEAMRLDLVDVVQLFWFPVLFGGGGIPVLSAGVRRQLRLRDERRFASGVVQATYDVLFQS
ncbi:dihydrofolate reductase family protein [Pseudonocardia endophytica]|uniref:Dihydrofolate reductase n=1 Tax=Pseudonocardia endophytica TaxID=401976 RepID=A0A4R1HDM5_PSEEN|nr:dihydrofolate reductase family protein [Pseudonocardia endophytica]TCK20157.1 dihydrofolate reductase [Pseudonocardia endophytica]